MRARRREINIFNMSLLDILCGALGAFCFMMLVALPYYIPPGSDLKLRKAQDETDRLLKQLSEMKERMPDQKSVAEMEELMRQLEAQVKALQGQLNILTAEKEQLQQQIAQLTTEKNQLAQEKLALQAQNENLTLENQNLKSRLAAKKALEIVLRANDPGQRIDAVVFRPSQMEKTPNPLFQEWLAGKFDHLHTVRNAMLYGSAVSVTLLEDAPPNSEGLLFVRLMNEAEGRKQVEMFGAITGDEGVDRPVKIPKVTLTPERFWTLYGKVSFDQASQVNFKEATEAEREVFWKKISGTDAPPVPTSTPTPPPSAVDRATMEAERQKRLALHNKFNRLNQLNPTKPEEQAEMINLGDELLKELPANDGTRRIVQSLRQHALDEKARAARPAASP